MYERSRSHNVAAILIWSPSRQVTSSYTAPCVLNLVSQDADIVLLEFTFNDSQRGNHKLEDPTTCATSHSFQMSESAWSIAPALG